MSSISKMAENISTIKMNKHRNMYNILLELQQMIPDIIMDIKDSDTLNNLCNEINHVPSISLLGKSGDGKSSLINKLLNKPNLLDTFSKKGVAVTSCPYELYYGKTEKFEIEYDDLNTIDDDCKKDILITKNKIDELHFNIIWDENLEELIKIMSNEIDIFNKEYSQDYIKNNPLSKALSFYKTKRKLTTNGYSFKISPLIKNIKIYLPCDILKIITLVDLPGLNDSCQYRIKRTLNYLNEKTNIIALIDNCERIASDTFIDKNLNTYIINSIIRNNIKDILIVGTKSDQQYEEIKEQLSLGYIIDSDDSDSDDSDNDSDNENFETEDYKKNLIEQKFKKNISDITRSLKKKIMDNEELSIRNITNNDIHIVITSTKLCEQISNIRLLKDKFNEIIKFRNIKLTNEFKKITSKLYSNFDDYINRPSNIIEEYTKNLIEHELNKLINDIKIKYSILDDTMKLIGPLFTLETTKNIKQNLEHIKESYIEVHGATSTAIVKKLVHTSSNNITYDISENIIHEIHTSFLKRIFHYINKLDKSITNKKAQDNICISNSGCWKLIKQIYPSKYVYNNIKEYELDLNNILKGIKTAKSSVGVSLYKDIMESSLKLITDEVKSSLQSFKERANENYGNGTSIKSRQLITEIYTEGINDLCIILDTKLIKSFNSHIDDEQGYINYNINKIMTSFKQQFIKTKIDLTHSLEKFNELKELNLSIN